jgi:hypothetical protein
MAHRTAIWEATETITAAATNMAILRKDLIRFGT